MLFSNDMLFFITGFAIGAMIHEGLIFGGLFEMKLSSPCLNLSEIVRPALHLVFIFIQLYFIFMNSKVNRPNLYPALFHLVGLKLISCRACAPLPNYFKCESFYYNIV